MELFLIFSQFFFLFSVNLHTNKNGNMPFFLVFFTGLRWFLFWIQDSKNGHVVNKRLVVASSPNLAKIKTASLIYLLSHLLCTPFRTITAYFLLTDTNEETSRNKLTASRFFCMTSLLVDKGWLVFSKRYVNASSSLW